MITKKEVEHIAGLARIGVSSEELGKLTKDLSSVLDWIDELKKVDISGIEPTAHITGLDDITREDKANKFLDSDKIINLFPEKKERYDRVKAVL